MNTLLLHSPSMPMANPMSKRTCCLSSTSKPHLNSYLDQDRVDSLLESLLGLSNSAVDRSFDRILDSRPCGSEQADAINCALRLGSALLEAGKRASRKLASVHNAVVWALPSDLTIKVFSMLDTQSVCYAAATCSFFHKCAADPACYADIDLVTVVPKVNNVIVATMIQRAGKAFRSLKLGISPGPQAASSGSSPPWACSMRNSTDATGFSWNDKRSRQGKESSILTRSCLTPLSSNGGTAGSYLRTLHLINIERLDITALNGALSVCPSLRDLEIVGLHVELRHALESVSKFCPLIERLFFESSKTGRDDSLKLPPCYDLLNNCPELSSLALRGFRLHDSKARALVKGFRKLKYIDFSTSYSITGAFLKNLGSNAVGSSLEVLMLRDCMHLKEVEVARFLSSVLAGEFKHLKHIDISNREGLASEGDWLASEGDWYNRCCSPSFIPFEQLREVRPGLCLLAEFPRDSCFVDIAHSSESSDFNSSSLLSFHSSDEYTFTSSPEINISEPSSGNEDNQEASFAIGEESSDEVGFS